MHLNYQYAHHSHDESEEAGLVDAAGALEAFDTFDWEGQSALAEELEKCSPTLSLITLPKKNMIWVSSFKNGSSLTFVSQCLFPGEKKRWFGLGTKLGTISVDTQNFSTEEARKAIELYVSGNMNELRSLYESA
ncbi:hypothetical protein BST95_11610 [Halioglobus japonicus]|uniref:Uncharacterized protein n=1 Tax=Halioglobus japonicus TaxID=930805 RepID=A0AAP8SNT2_9GAMM|nr:hypothetical protein [Halioglobus japonicus]AQA18788.1 hypothetical protein BST95_11610 [Halioglobus japonicus]PLW86819.1 hypothetical protein C0029_10605 [Halioglobus japonicus]GHD23909.1 hypothetical protein GCM10007052_37110 [Halioglobus japonicus]